MGENRVSYLDPVGNGDFRASTEKGESRELVGKPVEITLQMTRAWKFGLPEGNDAGNDSICEVARRREQCYDERKFIRPWGEECCNRQELELDILV